MLASLVFVDLYSLPTLSTRDSDLQKRVLTAVLGLLANKTQYRWLSAHTIYEEACSVYVNGDEFER